MQVGSARRSSWTSVIVVLVVGVCGCEKAPEEPYRPSFADESVIHAHEYVFGVHPLHNPQRLLEVFGPLTDLLSERTPDATFKLEASRNYAAYDEKLYGRRFHFSLPNPYQTVRAVDKGYEVIAKMGDDENFRGIILVRRDSGIEKVSDLAGKAVSYPAPTALAATMMPQFFLHTHGVDVMNEVDSRYVGSQESSIMNVFLGETAAGSTWPPPWLAFSRERPQLADEMRVAWETEPLINNGVVVLPEVPADVRERVRETLVHLHEGTRGREILARMELSRFEPADNQSYEVVRDFIRRFSEQVRPL
jgi:phosphonate transport system substrate-binding protein